LREFLCYKGYYTNLVTLTFTKIEGIINDDLPFGALRKESWWRNSDKTPQGYAWINGGWKVQNVNLKERSVTFQRVSESRPINHRKKPIRSKEVFTPVPIRSRKPRKPSKTKISKALARARNIERRKMSMYPKIKSKAKSRYQKKMYQSDAKPSRQD
jgi:hypothetical protein